MCSGQYSIICTSFLVTVEIRRIRKAKSFVVHVDKVKPFVTEMSKSSLIEANSVDTEH